MIEQGFFVNKEIGPFDKLSEARKEARKISSKEKIFYGTKDEMYLVPNVKELRK